MSRQSLKARKALRSLAAFKGAQTRAFKRTLAERPLGERPTPYVLIHPECGKPAYRMTRKPAAADVRSSYDARHLDGSAVGLAEPLVCGSCGRPFIDPPRTWHIRPPTAGDRQALRSASAKKGWATRRAVSYGESPSGGVTSNQFVKPQPEVFTATGTWTKPPGVPSVVVTVQGGGGGAVVAPDPNPWLAISTTIKRWWLRATGWLR